MSQEILKLEKPEFLSPSTINSFISYRHSWYSQKVLGRGFSSTHYFERGKAIEEGVRMVLEGSDLAEATRVANKMIRDGIKSGNLSKDDVEECSNYVLMMEDFIKTASDKISQYGKLRDREDSRWTKLGVRIEFKHPLIPIPLYGFLDFLYDDVCVDLKVKAKKPSGLDQGYIQQGLIYQWGTGVPVVFENLVYTSKGYNMYPLWLNKVPFIEKQEKYLVAAANNLIAVYDAIYEGDCEKLLKAMSFPNLSAVWNKNEKDELFEDFVTNCPFINTSETIKRNPLTSEPIEEKPKEDIVSTVLSEPKRKSCPL